MAFRYEHRILTQDVRNPTFDGRTRGTSTAVPAFLKGEPFMIEWLNEGEFPDQGTIFPQNLWASSAYWIEAGGLLGQALLEASVVNPEPSVRALLSEALAGDSTGPQETLVRLVERGHLTIAEIRTLYQESL